MSDDLRPQTRLCSKHGLITHYRCRDSRRASGYRWRCKRCVGEAVLRRKRRIKAILVAEAGGSCQLCGYDRFLGSLQFHHIDPSTKTFDMNMGTGKSLARFRVEASKCVLVCANCHGEIEAGIAISPPARATSAGADPRDA